MKIIKEKLLQLRTTYPIEQESPLDQILFLDIETTGFSAATSTVYLIGCIFHEKDCFYSIQWFAENPQEESIILKEFILFCDQYRTLIHFNGNRFDVPYLTQKAKQYNLADPFSNMTAIDLYKRVVPCKHFLKLPDCRQKTIELFLNVSRDDLFHGGELISVYQAYVLHPDSELFNQLIQHNADDLSGLVLILPILAYSDLFFKPLRVKKVQANYYKDITGEKKQEILMSLAFPTKLPVAISYGNNNCYFTGSGNYGTLKVPIFDEEMKYYYSNYKDYYFLPVEDMALHKSVSSFVSKENRTPATAHTCYTRKRSLYLPQWEVLFEPFFKRDYDETELFFELTEEFKQHRDAFSHYASHIMQMLLKYK